MKRKNVLYLHRNFLMYDKCITKTIESDGYNVFSYSINPSFTILERIKQIINPGEMQRVKVQYQQEQILYDLQKNNIVIDIVLVIAGQDLREDTLLGLKKIYPNAKFIWYIWDGVCNLKEYFLNNQYFDTIITFDKIDAKEYGLKFLPLFYINRKVEKEKKYDISFIGTDHSVRMRQLNEIIQQTKKYKKYIYLLNGGLAQLNRYMKLTSCMRAKRYLKLRPLAYEKTIDVMSRSKCVIDLPHSNQTGLTMRTIEALGTSTKLITTNKQVENYDFYDSHNIYILDSENILMPDSVFFEQEYQEVPDEIVNKYSIKYWCQMIEKYF